MLLWTKCWRWIIIKLIKNSKDKIIIKDTSINTLAVNSFHVCLCLNGNIYVIIFFSLTEFVHFHQSLLWRRLSIVWPRDRERHIWPQITATHPDKWSIDDVEQTPSVSGVTDGTRDNIGSIRCVFTLTSPGRLSHHKRKRKKIKCFIIDATGKSLLPVAPTELVTILEVWLCRCTVDTPCFCAS